MPRKRRDVPSVVRHEEGEREEGEAPPLWEGVSDLGHPVGKERADDEADEDR